MEEEGGDATANYHEEGYNELLVYCWRDSNASKSHIPSPSSLYDHYAVHLLPSVLYFELEND